MRTLTLHIELFVHHSLLFRLYNLLCRTAQHAQPFVPKVNLICTNIFMCKVLRKNNFSSNHSTSKNLITKIQNYLKMSSEKDVAYIQPSKRTVGFTLLQIKATLLGRLKIVTNALFTLIPSKRNARASKPLESVVFHYLLGSRKLRNKYPCS